MVCVRVNCCDMSYGENPHFTKLTGLSRKQKEETRRICDCHGRSESVRAHLYPNATDKDNVCIFISLLIHVYLLRSFKVSFLVVVFSHLSYYTYK